MYLSSFQKETKENTLTLGLLEKWNKTHGQKETERNSTDLSENH